MCLACAVAAAPLAARRGDAEAFPREAAAFPWPSGGAEGRPVGGTITWTGVAGFVLEQAGTRVAFDPFVTRPGLGGVLWRRPRPDASLVERAIGRVDAVFLGHAHYDHAMDVPALAAASPAARFHGSRVTVELCRRLGVSADRLVEARDGLRTRVGPFEVEAVASRHGKVPVARWFDRVELPRSGLPSTPFRYPRGDVLAWRVEVGGRSLHLQGSAGIDDAALERQPPADVLVACLAARKGTPRYLERLAERLRPKVLVPCHHDDFFRPLDEPPRPVATLRWTRFLAEAEEVARRHGTRLWLPVRGVPAGW